MSKELDARSFSIGRDVSQHEPPRRMVPSIPALVYQNTTVEEASKLVL